MALTPPVTPSPDGIEHSARRGGGIDARLPRPLETGLTPEGGAVGGGLVYSSTSDTRPPNASEQFSPDPHISRLRRLKRSVLTSARLIQEELNQDKTRRYQSFMVTLTYRVEDSWCPYQITAYIKRVRQWATRRGFPLRYIWVHELTKAGKTHYHVLFWIPIIGKMVMPAADRRGWWPHGMTQTVKVERNAVGYVAKYASKGTDDKLPKGARLSGSGGLSADSRSFRAWWMCPGYIRAWCPDYSELPRRLVNPVRKADGPKIPGTKRPKGPGGWICKASGRYLPSQYEIVSFYPVRVRRKVLIDDPDTYLDLAAASCIQTRQLYSGFTL